MNELINGLYNKIDNQEKIIRELQEENKKLKNDINALKGEIRVHSDKSNNRYKAIKTQEKHIAKLHLEAQRYFDELIETTQRINEAIEFIEHEEFGDKYGNFVIAIGEDNGCPEWACEQLIEILKGENNE